jgi:site-specific recombinase XerD
MTANVTFPALLQAFFTDRLLQQKQVSPHTVASYRDTFCLLLRYAQQRLHKTPAKLTLAELNAPLIIAFLEHLQQERGTSARSRNVRLAAIHSFFQYAALQAPNHSGLIEQVLAIPSMRYARNPIEFLTHVEIEALLAATDQDTWLGRRDRTLLLLALQTGLRVSELIGLRWQAIVLGTGAHVRCQGKGRTWALHPTSQRYCRRITGMAARATGSSGSAGVPQCVGSALESRRSRLSLGQVCCNCLPTLPYAAA